MSGLTVPRAGLRGGQTAAALTPTPQGGDIVAQLGQTMKDVGTALENDRLDRQMARRSVDIEKDLGQARLDAEAIGDPDELDAFWSNRRKELQAQYAEGVGTDGRPLVDPRNLERFQLAFDSVANRHGLALGGRGLDLRQSQRRAVMADYEATVAPEAARADPTGRDQIYADYDAKIDAEVSAARMTPEQGAEKKRGFRADTQNAEAIRLISEDPETFKARDAAGDFDALPADTRAGYVVRADAVVAANAKAAEVEAKQARADRMAALKPAIDDLPAIIGAGRTSSNEALLDDPQVQADYPEKVAQARGAQALRDQKKFIAVMTPAELKELRTAVASQDVTREWQNDALAAIDATLAADAKGWAVDAMQYARDKKLPGYAIDLPSDLNADPAATRSALATLTSRAGNLVSDGYVTDGHIIPLTRDQQAAIKAAAAPDQDPAARAELALSLTETIGTRDPKALTAMGLDPVFLHAGGLLGAGGNRALATDILRGQQEMKLGNVVMPPEKDRKGVFFDQAGSLFQAMPGGTKITAGLMASADALYATRSSVDASGQLDADAYAQSLHEVMGGGGQFGDQDATGGLAEINDTLTVLPMEISPRQVSGALETLADTLEGREDVRFGEAANPRYQTADAVIQAAGAGESAPSFNGRPLTADDWREAALVPIGDDQYVMVRRIGNEPVQATAGQDGKPWVISLRGLLQGVAAMPKLKATDPNMTPAIGDAP